MHTQSITTGSHARPVAGAPGPHVDYNAIQVIWRHRALILRLVSHDFRARFRGSQLGLLWSLLGPLVMLAAYTFVFSTVLQARWSRTQADAGSTSEFALILFSGLIPYSAVAETLNSSPRAILSVPNYVKRVVFPLEVLPVVTVGSAIIQSLMSVVVLVLGILVVSHELSPYVVLLPIVYVPLMLVCLSLSWFLASVGVFVKDVGHAVMLASQLLLFVTPIFYSTDIVPEPFRTVLQLNPLTGIVESFRRILLWNQQPDWLAWMISLVVGACAAYAGYLWFMKTKPGFAEVL